MKKLLITILFLINLYGAACPDASLLNVYEQTTSSKYNSEESQIAQSINNLTSTINSEIIQLEQSNLLEYQHIENLKESEVLSRMKNNFYLKQNNEIQNILNSIKAE